MLFQKVNHIIDMDKRIKNLENKFFGRLRVIKYVYSENKRAYWLCKCICGKEKTVSSSLLLSGDTSSCGCLQKEKAIERLVKSNKLRTKHGKSKTRFYGIWLALKKRCTNPNDSAYKYYGERGIKCLWLDFDSFRDDMYTEYEEHVAVYGEHQTTIDRIDNQKGYSKENCRWATRLEQGRNVRKSKILDFNGQSKHLSEWAPIVKIKRSTISRRLGLGWSTEKALTRYVQ